MMKSMMKAVLPTPLLYLYRFLFSRDKHHVIAFLLGKSSNLSFYQRFFIIKQSYVVSEAIPCPHTQHEILTFVEVILSLPREMKGCIVEAGSYKGGSTAKFSIAAKLTDREMVVFDSFQGIPKHDEHHDKSIFGSDVSFPPGAYDGTLDEVKRNIRRFGVIEVCTFIKGWFDDTMPAFSKPIAAIYLDVDLASSTRTCLKYLFPLLVPGGVLCSQDGHLPLVLDVFKEDDFWKKEVGCPKPHIDNLGKQKLIKIVKLL